METIALENLESNANLKKKRSEINWELEEEDNFKGNKVCFNLAPINENNCAHMYEYTDDICGLEDICDLETDDICGLENYLA